MSEQGNIASRPSITLVEAKKILGTTATAMSDDAISRLVLQIDSLTDIVVAYAKGSNIQSSIDISKG